MIILQESAWAKLNLALDVGAQRPDGFHEMRMIMQSLSLHDDLSIHLGTGRWWVHGPASLPHDERNLALRAARAFSEAAGVDPDGVEIHLEKRIPSMAGLGGGSADAAAVLRALQRHYASPLSERQLLTLAASIGSDVPYCVQGGTRLAEGRGEILHVLPPMPDCHIVLCQPSFGCSTPALFRAVDASPPQKRPDFSALLETLHDLRSFAPQMVNVFEPILSREYPVIEELKQVLLSHGAMGAMLTGTGSVVFGLFSDAAAAERACAALRDMVPWAVCTRPRQPD